MVMTLVIVADEDDADRRDGRGPRGLPRAPGPGARRDPRRRPRRAAGRRPGRHRRRLDRRDRADPAERRGGQAPRVGGAAAAAARLPRRRLVADRPARRPGRRPARRARAAPDHRRRRRHARQGQGAARPVRGVRARATPTSPGPGSRRGGRCSPRPSTSTRSRSPAAVGRPPSGSARAPTCWSPGSRPAQGRRRAQELRRPRASPRSCWRPSEGPIRISRPDGRLATFSSPGHPDRPVALQAPRRCPSCSPRSCGGSTRTTCTPPPRRR